MQNFFENEVFTLICEFLQKICDEMGYKIISSDSLTFVLSDRRLFLRKKDPKATLALPPPEPMELWQFIVMRFWQVYYSDRREQLGNLLQLIQTANEGSGFHYVEEINSNKPCPTSFFSSC